MLAILQVVAPVFAVVAVGYAAVRAGLLGAAAIDGVMAFAVRFAVPALLFAAIYRLDLAAVYSPGLLISFYAGSVVCFVVGVALARIVFRRRPGEAVVIGFCALFANTLLLGLPIMERAYGPDALAPNFAIIALHAPFCYLLGIVTMEFSRRDGAGPVATVMRAARAMFSNAITLGLAAGFALNLGQIAAPAWLLDGADLLGRAALPAALFGMGGALTRYALRDDLGVVAVVIALSLAAHPAIAWGLGVGVFQLSQGDLRAVVVTAAMPTGLNGYLFAAMYGRAEGAAASIVLLGTAAAVLGASFWLWALGGAALG